MKQQASFDERGKVTFEEIHGKVDTSHLQGAMFSDRPDLWAKKRRGKAIPRQQLELKGGSK